MSFRVLLVISNLLKQRKFNAQNFIVIFWTYHKLIAFRYRGILFLVMKTKNWMHALYLFEKSSQFRCASTFLSFYIINDAIFFIKNGIASFACSY